MDVNGNGVQDPGEPGLAGVTVTLQTPTGTLQTVTDGNGNYTFTGLISATYIVTFSPAPGNYGSPADIGNDATDSDPSPVTGVVSVPIFPGVVNTTTDAGFWQPSTLSGTVYVDFNNNGVLDPGEPPVPGTIVTLTGVSPVSGVVTLVTVTGPDGSYVFPMLPPGVYTLTEQQPAEWLDNADYPGNAGGIVGNDVIGSIVLTSGTTATGYDFTEQGATVGDYVWFDADHDGSQDDSETGLAGVTVTLQTPTGPLTFVTGATGAYSFTNLQINTPYTLTFTAPVNYSTTVPNNPTPGDLRDSDIDPAGQVSVILTTSVNPTVDAGFWQPSSVAGSVYVDANNNGARAPGEYGIPGVIVTLTGQTTNGLFVLITTTTDASGYYTFTNLDPGTYNLAEQQPGQWLDGIDTAGSQFGNTTINDVIQGFQLPPGTNATGYLFGEQGVRIGDLVWEDLNHNGQQDPGEPGTQGVTVTLQTITGTLTTYTDATGAYTFTDQPINTALTVTFSPAATYVGTLQDVLTDTTDSDADPLTGIVAVILTTNTNTVDAGFWRPMTLGSQVWLDVNNNGVLDAGEVGVNGVVVELYRDSNGSGVYEPGIDGLVATSTTVNGGFYSFTELSYAGYFVVLPSANFTGGAALVNYQNSTATVGGNTDLDNVDHGYVSGVLGSGGIVASSIVTLTPGMEPGAGVDGDGTTGNLTVDFGFYQLTLASQLWQDNNNNGQVNPGEPGLAGVTVVLLMGGSPVATTTTDASGNYTFTGLMSGTYQVAVTPPPGYVSTIPTTLNPNGNVDGDDNGLTPTVAGGPIVSNPIDLTPGNEPVVVTSTGTTVNTTLDFGLWQPSQIGDRVWYDVNGNGTQDPGETGFAGVTVTLFISTPVGWQQTAVSVTNGTGLYTFTNLISGTYYASFTIPSGYSFTVPNVGNPATDSNAIPVGGNPRVGTTPPLVIPAGLITNTVDAGVWTPVTLLSLYKSGVSNYGGGPPTVTQYSRITYTLVLTNVGPYVSHDTRITDVLPAGTSYVAGSATTMNGAPVIGPDPLVWLVGDLPVGGVFTATFAVTVDILSGMITNVATAGNQWGPPISSTITHVVVPPTSIQLVSLRATRTGQTVAVTWQTANEVNTLGYRIYRSTSGTRVDATLVSGGVIAATGAGTGASYAWVDANAPSGASYYWLEEVETNGAVTEYGPASVGGLVRNYLPNVAR